LAKLEYVHFIHHPSFHPDCIVYAKSWAYCERILGEIFCRVLSAEERIVCLQDCMIHSTQDPISPAFTHSLSRSAAIRQISKSGAESRIIRERLRCDEQGFSSPKMPSGNLSKRTCSLLYSFLCTAQCTQTTSPSPNGGAASDDLSARPLVFSLNKLSERCITTSVFTPSETELSTSSLAMKHLR
jgi:hypothetical protein